MKPNPQAAAAYELHTAHKTGDWRQRFYLGLAENPEEVVEIITSEPPAHYCIIASCVDGSPTLRLNYPDKTNRIGLRLLPKADVFEILDRIDAAGIHRRDRLNALDRRTLKERWLNKLVRRLTGLLDGWNRWRYRRVLSKRE